MWAAPQTASLPEQTELGTQRPSLFCDNGKVSLALRFCSGHQPGLAPDPPAPPPLLTSAHLCLLCLPQIRGTEEGLGAGPGVLTGPLPLCTGPFLQPTLPAPQGRHPHVFKQSCDPSASFPFCPTDQLGEPSPACPHTSLPPSGGWGPWKGGPWLKQFPE